MANVRTLTIDNVSYDIEDSTARTDIAGKVGCPTTVENMHVPIFDGATGKVVKDSGFTIGVSVPADAKFTDTTYESITTKYIDDLF